MASSMLTSTIVAPASYTNHPSLAAFRRPKPKPTTLASKPRRRAIRADVATHKLLVSLGVAIAIPTVGGVVDSALFQAPNLGWYQTDLRKPSWNPPNWLFGAAWSLLYPLMGLASWLVWLEGGWRKQAFPLVLYGAQLVLNLVWPATFFGAKRLRLALVDILALAGSLAATASVFSTISPLASRLLLPYLAWVLFATALNVSYIHLNSTPLPPPSPPTTTSPTISLA